MALRSMSGVMYHMLCSVCQDGCWQSTWRAGWTLLTRPCRQRPDGFNNNHMCLRYVYMYILNYVCIYIYMYIYRTYIYTQLIYVYIYIQYHDHIQYPDHIIYYSTPNYVDRDRETERDLESKRENEPLGPWVIPSSHYTVVIYIYVCQFKRISR